MHKPFKRERGAVRFIVGRQQQRHHFYPSAASPPPSPPAVFHSRLEHQLAFVTPPTLVEATRNKSRLVGERTDVFESSSCLPCVSTTRSNTCKPSRAWVWLRQNSAASFRQQQLQIQNKWLEVALLQSPRPAFFFLLFFFLTKWWSRQRRAAIQKGSQS